MTSLAYETMVTYLPADLAERLRAHAEATGTDLCGAIRGTLSIQLMYPRPLVGTEVEAGARHTRIKVTLAPAVKAAVARAAQDAGMSRSTWIARVVADAVSALDATTPGKLRS